MPLESAGQAGGFTVAHRHRTCRRGRRDQAYRRYTAFDEAIALLFPQIEDDLATSFGAKEVELRQQA
jgi:hypothetical protein